jgi:hypothetical protein
MSSLIKHHNNHLKKVYGERCFQDVPMNYGWCTDDNSITTKIYKPTKLGDEFLTTIQIGRKFVFENGNL